MAENLTENSINTISQNIDSVLEVYAHMEQIDTVFKELIWVITCAKGINKYLDLQASKGYTDEEFYEMMLGLYNALSSLELISANIDNVTLLAKTIEETPGLIDEWQAKLDAMFVEFAQNLVDKKDVVIEEITEASTKAKTEILQIIDLITQYINSTGITNIVADISALQDSITEIRNTLATHEASIQTNANNIATQTAELNSLKETVTNNIASIQTNANDIVSIKEVNTAQQEQLNNIEQAIDANTLSIANNTNSISNNANDIATIKETNTSQQEQLNNIEQAIDTNTTGIAVNLESISNLKTTVDAQQEQLNNMEQSIDTNTTGIAVNLESINNLKDRLDAQIVKFKKSVRYMGSVSTASELDVVSATNQVLEVGDMYNVQDTDYNYIWTGTEWDNISTALSITDDMITTLVEQIMNQLSLDAIMHYKGEIAAQTELEAVTDPTLGDTYLVTETNIHYIYNGTVWVEFSGSGSGEVDLSGIENRLTELETKVTEIETKITELVTKDTELEGRIEVLENLDTVVYQGSVENYTALEAITEMATGDLYFVTEENSFYLYDGTSWIKMTSDGSSDIDLSNYYTKEEIDNLISAATGTDLTNYYTKTEVDELITNIDTTETDLSNYVDLTSEQTITGAKTFTEGVTLGTSFVSEQTIEISENISPSINVTGYYFTGFSRVSSSCVMNSPVYKTYTYGDVTFSKVLTNNTSNISANSQNVTVVIQGTSTVYGIVLTKTSSLSPASTELIPLTEQTITSPVSVTGTILYNSKLGSSEVNVIGYSSTDWTPSTISEDYALPILNTSSELIGWYPVSDEAKAEVEGIEIVSVTTELTAETTAESLNSDNAIVTKKFLDEAIQNATVGDIDLSNYYNKEEVDALIPEEKSFSIAFEVATTDWNNLSATAMISGKDNTTLVELFNNIGIEYSNISDADYSITITPSVSAYNICKSYGVDITTIDLATNDDGQSAILNLTLSTEQEITVDLKFVLTIARV